MDFRSVGNESGQTKFNSVSKNCNVANVFGVKQNRNDNKFLGQTKIWLSYASSILNRKKNIEEIQK